MSVILPLDEYQSGYTEKLILTECHEDITSKISEKCLYIHWNLNSPDDPRR